MKLLVRVETYPGHISEINFHEAEPESMKIIDHNNSSDRKWLGTHCFWAMRNNRTVVTCAESN